jgi:hypothetical protein
LTWCDKPHKISGYFGRGEMLRLIEKYTIPETFYVFYMDGDFAVLVFLGNCNVELQCRQLVS